jgi:DNA-binding CsgD family transcriptional regulator
MKMGRPDPLRIIEAAYTWEETEGEWLRGVAEAAAPWSAGGGIVACTLQCDRVNDVSKVMSAQTSNGATEADTQAIRSICETLPVELAATCFSPTEFVGNGRWRLERIAKEAKVEISELTKGRALPSMWALVGGAPHERAIVLGFPTAPEKKATFTSTDPFPSIDRKVLGLVAAHMGAALRLRALGQPPNDDAAAEHELTEAVITPNGKILHANGEARPSRMRESLTDAVLRSEKARGRLRKVDSEEATRLWSALVEGRWSIVEATERDGKRFLLARRNTLSNVADLIELTKAENDVVWLAIHGHSHKYIAYELGLSVPAVSRRLKSALAKLRISSRRDLLRKLGAVVQH